MYTCTCSSDNVVGPMESEWINGFMNESTCILIIADYFTKWIEALLIKDSQHVNRRPCLTAFTSNLKRTSSNYTRPWDGPFTIKKKLV